MHKIAIIGAGKTGRGFIGRLLAENNVPFSLIDKDAEKIENLRQASFFVRFFGNKREAEKIENYTAHTWEDADFSETELIFVSVCGGNLKDVGAKLKTRLCPEKTYYIITCENSTNPAGVLQEAIGLENVYVSESTVFCTTIEDKGMDIHSENYPYLQFNADLLGDYIPSVAAIKPVKAFGNLLTRKLFTYNAASCIIAYLGYIKGYTDYADAANDGEILALLDKNYAVTNRVLCKEFGYEEAEQAEFALLSRNKFTDRTIADTVARNAREPHRKLARAERIIGPMLVMEKYGEDTFVLEKTAAAALLYADADDAVWQKIKSENTPGEILETICGLPKDSKLHKNILAQYETLQKK